jgi:hypothetical protein
MNDMEKVPKALQEVWDWKDACYRDVAHLPPRDALRTLLRRAEETARSLNLRLDPITPVRSQMIAEEHGEYGDATSRR